MSIFLKFFITSKVNSISSLLFLIVVYLTSGINFSVIWISTTRGAWSEEYYNSGRIEWLLLWIKTQRVKSRNNPCIGVTQENSIEFPVQSSLPYILVPMVHANYCAPYPKWPWVLHEVSICCPCYMTSLCSRTFYFILLNPVISLVTMPSNCDWCDGITDNP